MPSSRGPSQPRGQTGVSCIADDSLLSEPPGKPKNTGVGSLSLFQGNFSSEKPNQGLLPGMQTLPAELTRKALDRDNYHYLISN